MINQIIVASSNPTKIEAIRKGFRMIFPDIDFVVQGESVPTGVPDQPMSDEETLAGARNRVESVKALYPNAQFWAGIEGGIDRIDGGMAAFAWILIQSKNQTGKARSGTFFLPQPIVDLIDRGIELGEADDLVFQRRDSKRGNGAIGILTNDVIDRTELYAAAVVMALAPFIHPDLYNSGSKI